ncbi:hypothetical protein [Streptomyces scopuliridis]|uniref:hypothetical protein n=1 Tax=Streptomyces scopuliridis TaxID=452529 RepID=UPI0004BF95B3|nr:hypothetical protein [Streptomyces scopuliridis]
MAQTPPAFGYQSQNSSDCSAAPPSKSPSAPSPNVQRSEQRDAPGEAVGAVPDGVTVFDDEIPAAVANPDPDLLRALREAVSKYGSEDQAARRVATVATSPHVSGDAVDIGHSDATAWLSKHGAEYGLCPIYRNEPWHYELRTNAIDHGCPRMYDDPTQDPRMQQ